MDIDNVITPSVTHDLGPTDVNLVASKSSEYQPHFNPKDKETQVRLSSLGLDPKQVDFLLEQGEKYLKNSPILSLKLKIPENIAIKALDILEVVYKQDSEVELTREVVKNIKACLKEYPSINKNKDIALLCDISEELVAKYFESQPLTENQKLLIREKYNKDISVSEISDILKISSGKVEEHVETTFVTFSGEDGAVVLEIIQKLIGGISISDLRGKILSKNLKLQDQLGYVLPRESKNDYFLVKQYFSNYEESDQFLNIEIDLTMDDISIIKRHDKDSVEQLSTKLGKIESIISDYIHRYSAHPVENSHNNKFQAKEIENLARAFGTRKFSFEKYRTIETHSFDHIISDIDETCKSKKPKELLINLLPLAFYYLKCSLPFEDIARIIANASGITLTTHDVFNIIFQRSDPILRGLCIEHYSFSNPVPMYYPKLKKSLSLNTKFEICKELWYCLEQHNGIISFGLGRAGWNLVGKSNLLDMIFETDFVKGSPQTSAFHFSSIDIQITKNLFGELKQNSSELMNWAYIDCHSNANPKIINTMCTYLDIALIHVCYNDFITNRSELLKELTVLDNNLKHIYLLIRDCECLEVSVSLEKLVRSSMTLVHIPDLTRKDIKTHAVLISLKKIGYEILHLDIKSPKLITSKFLEAVLLELDYHYAKEIQKDNELVFKITEQIHNAIKRSKKVDFGFLNYYPHFVDYMSAFHRASYATDQNAIDQLNDECKELDEELKKSSKGNIVIYFNEILQRENSILILWKLSRELFHLSTSLTFECNQYATSTVRKEQKNDKYTLEIIWREALLSHKYGQNTVGAGRSNYHEEFASNFSKHVGFGEAFELIDGDNLRFFNKDIDALLRKFYAKQSEMLKRVNKGKAIKISTAPIVVSIFGPQSSGKSTLLNYCFGCKFLTSAGRCTRGIYGSLSKLDRPINLSETFLILDTEGLDAIERDNIKDTSMIHFDRTMVLFCLSVSQVVIINVKGDIGSEMQNLLQICAYSLQRLKVSKVKAPKIFFILNQQADPDPNKHLDSINLLMEKLNSESDLVETEGVKISDLIQVSRKNLFILPSAFNSQQINKPGAKLFDSNVIKLSPTISFADKCASLRVGIINQLDNMPHGDRAPFHSMSEWMEMAGVIWDTIIKYQDIVKYRNLEELMCSNKLNKIVTELLGKNIYKNQKEFTELTQELCKEIDSIESYLHPEIILTRVMIKFDEMFVKYQENCLKEFKTKSQEDPLLKKMEHLCKETLSNINRLIYVVRKQYEDQLKLQIKSVLTEIKLSESMKKFQEEIIENVDKYLSYSIEEQEKAFEETWNETFGIEDHEEEILEREENFSNLYSIFKMEYTAMENKQNIFTLFRNLNFDLDNIIGSIEEEILYRCLNPFYLSQEDKFFYPLYDYHIPIKEMSPYNGSSQYSYLCLETLYKSEKACKDTRIFTATKLTPLKWISNECIGLLKYCSGVYNHPDIIWKNKKVTQLNHLTSALRSPENLDLSSWEKFISDISSDVLKLLEVNPNVSHAIVKQIIHEFCFRIRLFNYEFGFIHACLSNTAERILSSLVFALSFKYLWCQKAEMRRKNREKKNTKKQDHLQYFLQKIKNRKMVRGKWNRETMAESDKKFSQKYALDYLESVKRGLITYQQQNYFNTFLEDRKDLLSHETILSLAQEIIFKELLKDPHLEVTNTDNFVVQFICNRNNVLKSMFEEKWREIETTLYQTISLNLKIGFMNKTSSLQSSVNILLQELENIPHEKVGLKVFDSDSNFELVENVDLKHPEMKEVPFKAMNNFLKKYLNPTITPENFTHYFSHVFEVDGHQVKLADTYSLCCKPAEPILDDDTFKKLENTKIFNTSELIFNIYEYVSQFKLALEQYLIELKQDEFEEMIATLKSEFEKNVIGCPSQCPSCGKFCEREIHPSQGKCQIKTGHQISSMGGKVWGTDRNKTAVLYMCDDYKDHTQVFLPCGVMEWGEFKNKCGNEWNWILPDDEKYRSKQQFNQKTMINVWNKFGRGILKYYDEMEGTQISYIPYTSYEEVNQSLLPVKYMICFVIDGTGSMGSDIDRARVSVGQLIKQFLSRGSSSEFRIVIYRDHCDENIIETFPDGKQFTQSQNTVEDFLSGVIAGGGGDTPEAVLDGLATAATYSDWECTKGIRNKIIHIFDAPPHGNFPNYTAHHSSSNKGNCCCCNHGTKCHFDWKKDVWEIFKKFNIEYHGINTSSNFPNYEWKMKEELGLLCNKFQVVGKEVVNDAILQIFVDINKET